MDISAIEAAYDAASTAWTHLAQAHILLRHDGLDAYTKSRVAALKGRGAVEAVASALASEDGITVAGGWHASAHEAVFHLVEEIHQAVLSVYSTATGEPTPWSQEVQDRLARTAAAVVQNQLPFAAVHELIRRLNHERDRAIQRLPTKADTSSASPQAKQERCDRRRGKINEAITALLDMVNRHEGVNVSKIARQVGVSRSTLISWPEFMHYVNGARADAELQKRGRPRGYRRDGDVEAYEDSSDEE